MSKDTPKDTAQWRQKIINLCEQNGVKLSITGSFIYDMEALLTTVQAETDRNSRIDELEELIHRKVNITSAAGVEVDVVHWWDIEDRLATLNQKGKDE